VQYKAISRQVVQVTLDKHNFQQDLETIKKIPSARRGYNPLTKLWEVSFPEEFEHLLPGVTAEMKDFKHQLHFDFGGQ
jgi:hypothetical protein